MQLFHRRGNRAFGHLRGNGDGRQFLAALKGRQNILHHGLHDFRHTRHHMHIANAKPGRGRYRIINQARALGNTRHAGARCVKLNALRLVMRFQKLRRQRVHFQLHAKRRRNAIGGDVVMRRANAARGEDIGVFLAQRIHRADNFRPFVGHNTHFFHINADIAQRIADKSEVFVLRAPRQHFIADNQHGGGNLFLISH